MRNIVGICSLLELLTFGEVVNHCLQSWCRRLSWWVWVLLGVR